MISNAKFVDDVDKKFDNVVLVETPLNGSGDGGGGGGGGDGGVASNGGGDDDNNGGNVDDLEAISLTPAIGTDASGRGKISQTLVFSSKESRSRYNNRRNSNGPQIARANHNQQNCSDKKSNGGVTTISIQSMASSGGAVGRNRGGQLTKRGTGGTGGTGVDGMVIENNKEFTSYYYNTNKCNSTEWLNLTSLSGKNLDNSAVAALQINLPEDMRISKLLRRLGAEKSPSAALVLCDKLKLVIVDQNNSPYIRRSFDILAESLIGILKDGPDECHPDVAEIFGMMGFVIRNDFFIYKNWIVKSYKNGSLRVPMMRALLQTLKMDKINRDLKEQSGKLIELLKDYLENAEVAKLFISITNVIKQFSFNYPKSFEPHFTDIVDIVVGWHLETDQSNELKQHCSDLLQSFNTFWAIDMEFMNNLLGHFLEDIIVCGDEIRANKGRFSPILDKTAPPELCFASLVGAYNSVLKCSWDRRGEFIEEIGGTMLIESFNKITSVALIVLQMINTVDIISSINELIVIILDCFQFNIEIPFDNIFDLIRLQIGQALSYSECQTLSLLFAIHKILVEMKTSVPFEFIGDIFSQSCDLLKLKFVKSKNIYALLIKIYQEVLNIKNVSLLQEAYKHILIDLGVAIKSLPSAKDLKWSTPLPDERQQYTVSQAECTITYYLTCLSALAISNSSIIAMWALQPSILELLTIELAASNFHIWSNHQSVHYAILVLISSHCRNNHNFISSSSLINSETTKISDVFNKLSTETPTSSPTSNHYAIILNFLQKILVKDLEPQQLNLCLDWCRHLIQQSAPYSQILKTEAHFTSIIKKISYISTVSPPSVILKCANCFDALYDFEALNQECFTSMAEVCCIQMCSIDHQVRERFSSIFAKLPLNVTLKQVNQYTGLAKDRARQVSHFQHWHNSHPTYGDMRPQYFKDFIDEISVNNNAEQIETFLKDVFINCWYQDNGAGGEFFKMALKDVRCLVSWAQWEAAQYCVNNKLRTALGKPQETFLKIESIIKEDARILALKEKTNVDSVDALISNQRHARVLLGFMENLEKAIYNASEGTAFALPAPEKPAKTFFHVNAPTCNEWFNRIRTAVDLVALHCMEPEMVIRYCEVVLKNLAAMEKTNEPLFEHTLMSYAWALLRNGESEALYGLYVWTKAIANRKFIWVKLAAEQAAGRRETAIQGYRSILESPDEPKLDRHVRDFIADQLSMCYFFQENWEDMYHFISQEEKRSTPRVTIPLISVTSEQLANSLEFLKTLDKSILDMGDWEVLESGPSVSSDFSCHKLHSLAENTVWKAGLSESYDYEPLRMGFSIIYNALQECLRTKSREHLNNLVIVNHIFHKIMQNKLENKKPSLKSICVDKTFGSITLSRLLCWSEFLVSDCSEENNEVNANLRLDVCSMARKEGNLARCKRALETFFEKNGFSRKIGLSNPFHIEDICDKLTVPSVAMDSSLWDCNVARGVYETSKWLYCHPDSKECAIQLAASLAIGICLKISQSTSDTIESNEQLCMRQRAARTLLTLSEWVQGENEKLLTNDLSLPLTRLVTSLPEINLNEDKHCASVIPIVDTAVGKIIQYSTKQCPNLAKSWGALGNWCYRWGRKMVELRIEHSDKAGLRSKDITAISDLIANASKDDIAHVVAILNKQSPEDEDIGASEACSTEIIETQLRSVSILSNASQEQLHAVIDIWRQANKAFYSYYESSADAYFKYLHLATSEDESLENDKNRNCSIVTATLRLLRLIVKHALGLQDVLDQGLAATPTSPWKVIIPQLFSRLNHHEPYVRKRVSELLCRVAQDSPHLIIFPAVVGCDQERCVDIADISMVSEDIDIEDEEKNALHSGLTSCFNSLLDTLSKQAEETVQQVQLLVRELKRVTLLWDELWLVALAQVYSECSKRLANFDAELHKSSKEEIDAKNGLLIEKHRILMRPILFVVERLHAITSVKPETHNEQLFQEKCVPLIEDTIQTLKKPFTMDNPNEAWQKFKTLYGLLQQRAQKRAACVLKMTDISPVLAQMKNTAISMPGVEHSEQQLTYIKSVDNIVHILPTKTKPKKLVFVGCNGKRFTYLFKSLEDLHLDERIMQFLAISNSMMTRSTDCNGNVSNYRARHYSVIPLGPRSGLISWVDGLTPIFALYKKWQQREAANPKKDKSISSTRPSEMFLNKLTPLLAEHNLKITDNRKDWPLSVLRQVLSELSTATPRDLLAKELWCYSTNACQWREVIRNYSQSIAVMSVIGYVIGLGDRHLDNILIELSSGEVVHIDYNVCFEKGKTLRVPEKVPFRMTPNIEEALGVTGIEGTFRLACEHVLKALKKGRETLLTLLEAFVYDPLVDWAVGEDGAGGLAVSAYGGEALGGELRQARRQLEQEVTRDTLAIRFTEIKVEWTQNRDQIYQQLIDLRDHLHSLQKQRIEMQQHDSRREILSKQLAMVREAETLGTAIASHQLNSLSQRYGVYKRTKIEYELSRQALLDKSDECYQHIGNYMKCIDSIRSGEFLEHLKEIDDLMNIKSMSEFSLVKEFLENSAQGPMYVQSDQTRKELDSSMIQQAVVMKQIIESLIQYGNAVKFHPHGYIEQHRNFKYAEWCKYLSENASVGACREVVTQFQTTIGEKPANPALQHIMAFAFQIQSVMNDSNFNLQKAYDRLKIEIDSNDAHLAKLERNYEDAKYAIDVFLQEESGAIKALECVTLTAICDLNKRLLMIENAAASSGENLLDLTLNGKWFLDELYVIGTISTELIDIIYTHENSSFDIAFESAVDCFRASSKVYICLRDGYNMFIDTILSNVIEGIMSEDSSVLEMISNLSSLQDNLSPIPELLTNLHLHLRCSVLNMTSPHSQAEIEAKQLRQRLLNMKAQIENSDPVNAGGKLFLSFYGLFESLDEKQNKLIDILNDVKYAEEWKKIDQIKESRELATLIFNPVTRAIFEDIFIVRRLETMIEIFTLCLQMACAFKGTNICPTYDDELIARPLKKFISDYIWRLQLGISSHSMSLILCGVLQRLNLNIESEINLVDVGAVSNVSLEDLCRKGVDRAIKRCEFSSIALNHATTLCLNLDVSLRKKETINFLQNNVRHYSECLNRSQLLLTAHLWMFEEVTSSQPGFILSTPLNRTALLVQLNNDMKNLSAWRASLLKMRDEIASFVQAITQRLKWAVGANPALKELLTSFLNVVNLKQIYFEKASKMSEIVLGHCNTVLQYESLKLTTNEALEQDQLFLDLVSRWEKSCTMNQSCSTVITPVEEALVELLDPEGPIDHVWLNNVADLIDELSDQVQSEISQAEKRIVVCQDNLQSSAHKLRSLMCKHHRMGSEVRTLLRTTLKVDGAHIAPIRDYLKRYKEFLDSICELHGNVLSKDFTEEIVDNTLQQISKVLTGINGVFDDLFLFEHEFKDNCTMADDKQQLDNSMASPTLRKNKKGAEQKRNAYAVSVWRRIRMKLEGRDPDPTRRCTVQEQVDWMIREAMNPDNLAVLYEGWTPWV